MGIVARYDNPDHTSVIILSGYPGAPVIGENENPRNPAGQLIWNTAHDGMTPEPYREPTPTLADYGRVIEEFLNTGVAERQYSNIHTAISYLSSGNATWAAEAAAVSAWRDAVLGVSYGVLAQVEAGIIEPPTVSELIALLPALVWPV